MADSAEKTKKQSFFKNVQIEFKKISWPDRKTMFKQSVAVAAISLDRKSTRLNSSHRN